MKYIIDVPNQDYSYDKMLHTLKLKFYDDNLSCEVILDAEPYTEPDRKAIEDEVWELARRIICPSDCCVDSISAHTKEIFNKEGWEIRGIFNDLSYQEAKSLFEKWMENENELHVGDEVEYPPNKAKGIVVQCHVPDVYADVDKYAVFTGTSVEYLPIEWLTKTGRVFPEAAELLQKMRGEEE